ncbi:hypothetical protein MUK70_01615 [Dyadobacter chenwenxiniae]|uniref:Uncharacterized protein n=1 Tax=Dyadobacter chenwenxiniae TaxID=2906456 RepID=A0A9X1PPR1_9BACT|nr:hypothetical protein [Dyadobacter chenwenxiniae]MCF0062556.1 hypothetical protein [Dyadobacter chenwenxiniae]UON83700.1 hypothetical protein MUK70_01615 [Dyadobacter chenwenxiniae]
MAKKQAKRPVRPGTPAQPSGTQADSNPTPAPTDAAAATTTSGPTVTPPAEQTIITQDADVRAAAIDGDGTLTSPQNLSLKKEGPEMAAESKEISDVATESTDDPVRTSENAQPDYLDQNFWTEEQISLYKQQTKETKAFIAQTGGTLNKITAKQDSFAEQQVEMASLQQRMNLDLSSIPKKVADELHKIIDTISPEATGSKITPPPKMTETEYPTQHEEYKKFKEWLCEETKGGRSICEPEEERRLTLLSLSPCEPFLDLSDSEVDALAILRAEENHVPITDIEQLRKYKPFIKITICTKIEVANPNATEAMYETDMWDVIELSTSNKHRLIDKSDRQSLGGYVVKFKKPFFEGYRGINNLKVILGINELVNKELVPRYFSTTELFVNDVAAPHGERMLTKGLSNLSDILGNGVLKVQTQRNISDDTEHRTHLLWRAIRNRVPDFARYNNLMNQILGSGNIANGIPVNQSSSQQQFFNSGVLGRRQTLHPLPFTNIQAYRLLKSATQAYLWATNNTFTSGKTVNEGLDFYINSYDPPEEDRTFTPYIQNILAQLGEWRTSLFKNNPDMVDPRHNFFGIDHLPAIELIWSYWTEQGMMVQTMNAISLRFQNITINQGADPLAQMDIDPLRPLANLFWGYIQDEQHTLTIKRRAYEYDHTYGLQLEGRAVPVFKSVDSRSKFIEAFHNLLHSASIFFKESDDTTRVADPFSVLNNLREVHLLLAEGNHNAYGNLTWTARQEMLIQQYLLARPEMREFLGGRVMVPFREPWMDRVDRMRQIQNWGSTSITNYYDLAQFGEVLLLTIRAHDWSNEEGSAVAGSWASSFRNEIQRYLHSYRTVTGADLSADAQLTESSFMQPSTLIQRRLQGEQRGPLRNSRLVGKPQPQS